MIREDLEKLRDQAHASGYKKPARIMHEAAMEIKRLEDELKKTQVELKSRDEKR